jgi:hypothetical protein
VVERLPWDRTVADVEGRPASAYWFEVRVNHPERGILNFFYDAPFVPFPERPKEIKVQGRKVFEYISPEKMEVYLRRFTTYARYITSSMDGGVGGAYVNMRGGGFMHELFMKDVDIYKQAFNQNNGFVRYARVAGGGGSIVSERISNGHGLINLVTESCIDSGHVAMEIRKDSPNSILFLSCLKVEVNGQLDVPGFLPAVVIGNQWFVGCGGDAGRTATEKWGYIPEFGRNYRGIAVIPESLDGSFSL